MPGCRGRRRPTTFDLGIELKSGNYFAQAEMPNCPQKKRWAIRAEGERQQKNAFMRCLRWIRKNWLPELPVRVRLCRMYAGKQRKFDPDNLARGFKAIQDGIAKAFETDDGSDLFEWVYEQEKYHIRTVHVVFTRKTP